METKETLQRLLEHARQRPVTEQDLRETRRSFAYGNTKIENDRITKDMIWHADEELFGRFT